MGRQAGSTIPIWDTTWRLSEVEAPVVDLPQIQWANRTTTGKWPWEAGYDPTTALGGSITSQTAHYTDSLVELGMKWSSAKGDGGASTTGVRAWYEYWKAEGQSPDRPLDPASPIWVLLREETHAMQFCCSLVHNRGIAARSVASYFSQVQSWHKRKHGLKLAAGLKLERLPEMLKGLRRHLGDAPQKIRRGVASQQLRAGMDALLDPRIPEHANIRAALALAFQGLMRSAEYSINPGTRWRHDFHLSRADIKRLDSKLLVLMMHPCKNMHHIGGKTCPLVVGSGGTYIDAVAEMQNLFDVDATRNKEDTPLFRHPEDNSSITTDEILNWIKRIMIAVGENPVEFGTHSLRIGGATALFAAGADPTIIRTMGRWSSDLYKLYVRACFEKSMEWSRVAGSTPVHDMAGTIEFDEVADY